MKQILSCTWSFTPFAYFVSVFKEGTIFPVDNSWTIHSFQHTLLLIWFYKFLNAGWGSERMFPIYWKHSWSQSSHDHNIKHWTIWSPRMRSDPHSLQASIAVRHTLTDSELLFSNYQIANAREDNFNMSRYLFVFVIVLYETTRFILRGNLRNNL
jgi:hypothetical protein